MNHDTLSNALPFLTIALIAGIAVIAYLAICGLICFLVIDGLKRVPQQYRKIEPAMVWLLMIPCFGLIWNFFVFQRVPESFQSYFTAQGRTDVGDCGKGIGLWYAIASACSIIPWIGAPLGLAALVLLILNLVRYNDLKKKIMTPTLPSSSTPPPPTLQG